MLATVQYQKSLVFLIFEEKYIKLIIYNFYYLLKKRKNDESLFHLNTMRNYLIL